MTTDIATALDAKQARALTDQIKTSVEGVWKLIECAYIERAWYALEYQSWDEYCTREFGTARLRLPREERQEIVASLRDSGLSVRAISAATGLGYGTVRRQLDEPHEPNGSPLARPGRHPVRAAGAPATPAADEQRLTAAPADTPDEETKPLPQQEQATSRITGTDGKSYAASRPAPASPTKAKRRPLGAAVSDATRDLLRATERLARITEDDRFPRNREEVHHQMPDLLSALERAVQFIQAARPEDATANEEARRWWTTSLNTLSDALADVAKSIEKEN